MKIFIKFSNYKLRQYEMIKKKLVNSENINLGYFDIFNL